METQNYTTGREFLAHVDEMNQYIDKRANPALLAIIQAEVRAYGDALRYELHNRLENVVKATEQERMEAMTALEREITKSIAENARKDKTRFRWVIGSVLITLVNLTALVTLYLKLKGA